MKHLSRFIPLLIIVVLMALFYALGVNDYFSWEVFKEHRASIKRFVNSYPVTSPLIYSAIYALIAALSIPVAFLLSMIGGFLFPQPLSTFCVVVGATCGASILFLVAKTALHDFLKKKFATLIDKMRSGFQRNAISYMLLLRVLPIFPFWLVNIAPVFFKVTFTTFVWTTFVGIIPGAFVYTQAGRGIDAIFEGEGSISFWDLLNREMVIGLIGIIILAIIPMVVKRKHR